MTITKIQEQAVLLQARIFDEAYYPDIWIAMLGRHGMTMAGINEHMYTDGELVLLCHHVWAALPDLPSIRRGPFFALCNIAENILGMGDEPESENDL